MQNQLEFYVVLIVVLFANSDLCLNPKKVKGQVDPPPCGFSIEKVKHCFFVTWWCRHFLSSTYFK